jgi:predicted phosphodiesterase
VEVIRLLREGGIAAVRGNLDRKVIAAGRDRKVLCKMLKARKRTHLAWTALQLGDLEWEWLAALPESLELDLCGVAVLVVHGSPLGDTDCVLPSITVPALRYKLADRRPGMLVCGHSHLPFTRVVDRVRLINPGSVARPIDGDPRGTYALVEAREDGTVRARILRVSFDQTAIQRDMVERRVPTDGYCRRSQEQGFGRGTHE